MRRSESQRVVEWCPAYHSLGYHDYSLDTELSPAEIEEIFQVRTEQIDDEHIVQAFLAEMIDLERNNEQRGQC